MRPLALALMLALSASLAAAADPSPIKREEVGNRISENLPMIPVELRERLNQYQNTRGASFASRPAAAGNSFVFGKDVGGSEFWQQHLLK